MTKAALTKLLLTVMVMFIVCLPELFKMHRDITVAMTCVDMRSSDSVTYFLSSLNISFICLLQEGTQNETVRLKVFINQSLDISANIPNLCQNTSNDPQTPPEWFACASKKSVYTVYQELKSQALKIKGSLELEAKPTLPLQKQWDFTVSYAEEERQPLTHFLLEIHIRDSATENEETDKGSTNLSQGAVEDQRGRISFCLKLEIPVLYAMCKPKIVWLTLIPIVILLTLIFITYKVVWRKQKSLIYPQI
ncbi:transmembrane protein 156 [Rhinatrema bivittatum]|uniref:transmembrane protein 156 n=1 Tax=Rhinatrema bivittatum TaxID=194408 RepID=UPI0011294B1C|nr:transmembrane protein 156 [Rhinatrema bivittatum]